MLNKLLSQEHCKLDKEDIEFLKELGNRLRSQNNHCTARPLVFQIMEPVIEHGIDPDYCDDIEIVIGDEFHAIQDLEKAKEYILEVYCDNCDDEELEEHRAKLAEVDSFHELESYCESLGEDNVFCSGYRESEKYSGSFLTHDAAANHLRQNSHHYHRDAIVYCTHAWRNPELEKLLSIVENFGDVEYFSQKKAGA